MKTKMFCIMTQYYDDSGCNGGMHPKCYMPQIQYMGFLAYGILAPCRNEDEKMRMITMMNLILEVVLSRDLSRLTEPVKRMIECYGTSLEYYIL